MAKSIRVEMNRTGARAILRSPEVLADLERRAQLIANAAGEGMEVNAAVGANRARATVVTATTEAMIAEASDRALTSALDAGRG